MKKYETQNIKNIAILGHLGTGKTSFTESILKLSGAINKKGEVEKGTTVSDFLAEEKEKQTTFVTSLIPIEYKNQKINFLDLPGNEEFVSDFYNGLHISDGVIILIDAQKGIEVGTERVWKVVKELKKPATILINKMDKENIKYPELINKIITFFGKQAVPLQIPILEKDKFKGFIDVRKQKGFVFDANKTKEVDMYKEYVQDCGKYREIITETIAQSSDELLEAYFDKGTLSDEQIQKGLKISIKNQELVPIFVGSAINDLGIKELLDFLISDFPNHTTKEKAINLNNKEEEILNIDSKKPFTARVFNTIVDPFLGSINLIKVISGKLQLGDEVYLAKADQTVKIGQLFTLKGKNQVDIDGNCVYAGDIFATAKLDNLTTGETLSSPKNKYKFYEIEIPTPVIYVAVIPKTRQDEDKISDALKKLNIEDPSFETKRNKETSQLLIGGQGMTQLGFIIDRMKNMFGVKIDLEDQKIVYRETIKKKTEAEGKHKKQSGGAGQFGHVFIRFEPCEEEFVFAEEIFGGAVPKGYFPAVEKGLKQTFEHGPLAGFPVVKVKSTLYDGSYHPVDSNEISFVMAASLAFKKACETAKPTILEPIMRIDVTVKDQYVGDVMGDINKRRGRILGMDQGKGYQIISAEVPEAEITKYAIDLKAMTQGSGHFMREFIRYDEVPGIIIPKIIKQYKKE